MTKIMLIKLKKVDYDHNDEDKGGRRRKRDAKQRESLRGKRDKVIGKKKRERE